LKYIFYYQRNSCNERGSYYYLRFRDLRKGNRQPWQKAFRWIVQLSPSQNVQFLSGRNNTLGRNNRSQWPFRPSFSSENVCLASNRKEYCDVSTCPYRHVCKICRGPHPPYTDLVEEPVSKNKFFQATQYAQPFKNDVLNKELIGYNTALRDYLVSGFQYGFTCASIKKMWTKFQILMKEVGIEAKITLKHIVLGYKIDDKNCFVLNILLLVGFSIYKSYYRIYLNRKQSVLMLIDYLSMNILKE
jgi:hypothetical protein